MGALTRTLIESGSHVPGIDPALFGLPELTALRFEQPAPVLRPYVADYYVLDSIRPTNWVSHELQLPGGPSMRFILEQHEFTLAIGGGPKQEVPKAALFGSPSKSTQMQVGSGGVTVGVTLTAAGLARLRANAFELRDSIVALDTVLSPEIVREIMAQLQASNRGSDVKAILDNVLAPILDHPHPHDAAIRRIAEVIATPGVSSVEQAREMAGLSQRQMERLTKRYFGFSPKLLLRRARLLRSIMALKMADTFGDMSVIDPDYFDHSHFTRDAHRFLGMAPMQFLRHPSPYRDAVLRARQMVLGAGFAALDTAPSR